MSASDSPVVLTSRTDRAQSRLARLCRAAASSRFFAVLTMLVALFAYFSATQATFFTTDNVDNLLTSVSILFLVSIGLTFVMLSGGFDLSLGSQLALSGILLGKLLTAGVPMGGALVACLLAGAVMGGAINGVLIGRVGVPFLVVTLGTLSLFRGALNLWSDAQTTQVTSGTLDALAFDKVLGIPLPVIVMAAAALGAVYVLRFTYFGRDVYAVGGNAEAARLSGVRVGRTIIIVYAIAGVLAAAGAVMQVARIGAASPLVGDTIVFDAAAAVLLGGTSFAGGAGGVTGTVVGVLFLGVLQNGLAVSGVQSFWQQVITGAIVIFAVTLDRLQGQDIAALRGRLRLRRPNPDRRSHG